MQSLLEVFLTLLPRLCIGGNAFTTPIVQEVRPPPSGPASPPPPAPSAAQIVDGGRGGGGHWGWDPPNNGSHRPFHEGPTAFPPNILGTPSAWASVVFLFLEF